MKFDFKKVLPHAIAIVVFLIVSVVYTKPALDGKVLQQSDQTQFKGMSKDAENYRAKHGVYPEWTNGMFSGMPSYQIAFNGNATLAGWVAQVLGFFLPQITLYFFLACMCMYILSQVLRTGPWIGILGALAFAFATYNPIIVATGHHTKMMSLALIPAILAGLYLIYERRYWLGAVLTSFGTAGLFAYTHYQVIYYFFMIVGFMGVAYWITCIKAGQIKQMLIGTMIAVVAIVLGVMANSVTLMTNFDISKATIRNGSVLAKNNTKSDADKAPGSAQLSSTGLDSAYAFSYSMSIPEPLVMVVPRLFGGGGGDQLPEDGKTAETMQDVSAKFGPQAVQQLSQGLSAYWGGIGSTVGPPYSGAIVCFLALFGMFIIEGKFKWWMASIILLSIIMSWGGYFYGFNGWLLNHLPMYNKFRAPSMIIVIPQILLPVMAMLTVKKLVSPSFDMVANKKSIRNGLIAVGVLLVLILGFYFSSDFLSNYDQQSLKQVNTQQLTPDIKQIYKELFAAVAEDRKTVAFHDILRTLFILVLGAAVVFAILKKWVKPVVAIIALAAISFVDLITIDTKYLGNDSYQEANEVNGTTLEPELAAQPINDEIIKLGKENMLPLNPEITRFGKGFQDTIYRVADFRQSRTIGNQRIGVSPFQDASQAYHHHMIGGYHPAKLSIYQDLWENQISKGNPDVLNMLNTRFIMVNDQRGGDSVAINPNANGLAWFVKHIEYLDGATAIMKRLDHFDSKDTAVVDKIYEATIGSQPQFDSSATIKNTLYDNDNLEYAISTKSPQFAVLSEIYYKNGWQAFVDGKETPIVPVDYALRGINIPAGTQKLTLVFAPKSYITGKTLTNVASIIMFILLVVAVFFGVKKQREI